MSKSLSLSAKEGFSFSRDGDILHHSAHGRAGKAEARFSARKIRGRTVEKGRQRISSHVVSVEEISDALIEPFSNN